MQHSPHWHPDGYLAAKPSDFRSFETEGVEGALFAVGATNLLFRFGFFSTSGSTPSLFTSTDTF